MGHKLEGVRALAHCSQWRIVPARSAPDKYVPWRGSTERSWPPMTLAQIHRWFMLPVRQRENGGLATRWQDDLAGHADPYSLSEMKHREH